MRVYQPPEIFQNFLLYRAPFSIHFTITGLKNVVCYTCVHYTCVHYTLFCRGSLYWVFLHISEHIVILFFCETLCFCSSLELNCFLSFVSFVSRHSFSGTHRSNHYIGVLQ